MQDNREEDNRIQSGVRDDAIIAIPFQVPVDAQQLALLRAEPGEPEEGENFTEEHRLNRKDAPLYSTFSFHTPGETVDETVDYIASQIGAAPNASLRRAAQCAAFFKSLGVETVIYVSSMGALLVANGLLVRFAGFDPIASTLAFGGTSAIAYNNARLFFTSLLKPPGEDIPADKRVRYGLISKYAFLPLSFVAKAAVTGSILSTIGDTSFGTQQAVSAATSPSVGPMMAAIGAGVRACHKGSIILHPEYADVKTTFRRAYGGEANPGDAMRSYRWGTARDMISRMLALTAGTALLSYSGGFAIENYCGQQGKEALEDILREGGTLTGEDIDTYCWAGNFTFMFRELGISFGYAAGLLIVDPLVGLLMNRVYDFFYPRESSPQEAEADVHLVSGDEGAPASGSGEEDSP